MYTIHLVVVFHCLQLSFIACDTNISEHPTHGQLSVSIAHPYYKLASHDINSGCHRHSMNISSITNIVLKLERLLM